MPRRITNLRGMSSSNISILTYSKTTNEVKKEYVLFKMTIPTEQGTDYYKRGQIRVEISNITGDITLLVTNLTYHNFSNFDFDNIDYYTREYYSGMKIDFEKSFADEYLDITTAIKNQLSPSYEIYFCIIAEGNTSFSIDSYDFNNREEVVLEVINAIAERKLHEQIPIDGGIAGTGSIDLFNREVALNVLSITTNRNNSISLNANYRTGAPNGVFGANISADFEYKIVESTGQYIKIYDYNNSVSTFNYVSRSFAISTFKIDVSSVETYIYLNFDDLSYLVYENGHFCLYTQQNVKVVFHSYVNNSKLLVNQIIHSTRTINYNIENNKVKTIECDDDCIKITYTSNLVTRIDYNYNYNVIFEYQTYNNKKQLKKISYYKYDLKLGQDILLAKAIYGYSGNDLSDAYDDLSKIGLHFEYINSCITNVATKHMLTNAILSRSDLNAEGLTVSITNEKNETNYYYLDSEGKSHLVIDDEKNHTAKQYFPSQVLGCNDLLVGNSNVVMNIRNYIDNPCFVLQGSNIIAWVHDHQNLADFVTCYGKDGTNGIHIYNIRSTWFKISQNLSILSDLNISTLYFFGYIKGSGSIYINIKVNNVDDLHQFSASPTWQKISITKDLSNVTINSIEIIVSISKGHDIQISDFEINYEQYKDDNLLINTQFDTNNYSYDLEGWDIDPVDASRSIINNTETIGNLPFSKMLSIGGSYALINLSQRVNVRGNASDVLNFSFFTKTYANLNEVCVSFITVHYPLLGEKTYNLCFNSTNNNFRKIVHNVICESTYDYVTVGILNQTSNHIILAQLSFTKEGEANYYSYNKNYSLLESKTDEMQSSISFDKEHKLQRSVDASGIIKEYKYDSNNLLSEISDNNGNYIEYEYDDNKYLSYSAFALQDGRKLITKNVNDKYGNVLISRVNKKIEEACEYDDDNRLVTINNLSGSVEHITYDNKDRIIKKEYDLGNQSAKLEYAYNNLENIEKLKVENVEKYHYNDYDSYSSLKQIKLYNNNVNSFNYYTRTNNDETIYTGLLSSKTYSNGTYSFTYDNKDRLSEVSYNNNTLASYYYNKLGNINKIVDANGVLKLFYNKKNQVEKKELSDNNQNKISVSYEYDNLGSIQEKNIKIGDDILAYDYIYDYEYNEYNQGGYFSRLETYFNDDFLLEEKKLKYTEDEPSDIHTPNTTIDTDTARKVLRFIRCNQHLTFDVNSINKIRDEKLSSIEGFSYKSWRQDFSRTKTVLLWVKLTSLEENINDTKIVTFANDNTEIASLSVTSTGMLKFKYDGNNFYGHKLYANEWNFVGITLKEENNHTRVTGYSNGKSNYTEYPTRKVSSINKISFGDYLNETSVSLSVFFDILCSLVGSYPYTTDEIKSMYNEGIKYIFSQSINKASGVCYYNHSYYNDLDVFSFNGTLKSNRENKILEYTYGDTSYKLNKTKLFKLDNQKSSDDTEYTNRHIYGCFSKDIFITGESRSMLSYELDLHSAGFISFRFKIEEREGTTAKRTLLYTRDVVSTPTNPMFLVWVDNSDYTIKYGACCPNYTEKVTNLSVIDNKWHLISITWDSTHFKMQLDSQVYEDNNVAYNINLTDNKTYIACKYGDNGPTEQLNGIIEMFTYKDSYLPSLHSTLLENGSPISHLSIYDQANRIIKKEIITPKRRLLHNYYYTDEFLVEGEDEYNKINLYPSVEELESGVKIIYSYDKAHNIKTIVKVHEGEVIESLDYTYDSLNRLKEEKCYTGNTFNHHYSYSYDKNNNIIEKWVFDSSDTIQYIYVYVYSNTIKDQLIRIDKCDRHYDVISSEYINYSTNDPFRPSSYKGNNLTWQGRRLLSYGNNTYTYDSNGIRISKTTQEGTYTYILDGNKIIKEIKPHNINVYYHYDEKGMLVGFNYSNNEYFYVRDLTGNIINIIDSNGNIQATYKYDAYGKILDKYEELVIRGINSFFYKGYYFDEETYLYYCNSRYYDPDICRWISIDDISYLEIEDINSINLWCYCGNNPVMYTDHSGNFVTSIFLICMTIGTIIGFGKEYISSIKYNIESGGFQFSDLSISKEQLKKCIIGSLKGMVAGAALGIGAGLGASAFLAGTIISAKTALIGFGAVALGSFSAGVGIYSLETKAFALKKFDKKEMWKAGVILGIKGITNYGIGLLMGNQGFYAKKGISGLWDRIIVKNTVADPIFDIIQQIIEEIL